MYSLYRAWLSLGPCPVTTIPSSASPPPPVHHQPLNLSNNSAGGAPDVSLQVGPGMTQFSAHRAVLSAHSGFFKAALSHSENGPLAVPNVNVDEFSSLLTFMYTGFLDLNLGNIYNILLATHILHMPRALEICRSFLLQSQPISHHHHHHHHPILASNPLELVQSGASSSSTIIKPIPNRKTPSETVHQQIFAPSSFTRFEKSESTPFKIVISNTTIKTHEQSIEDENNEDDSIVVAATSATPLPPPPPPPPIVANPSEKKNRNRTKKASSSTTSSSSVLVAAASSSALGIPGTSSDQSEKVIIDIACCDGPVRFHRVINKNYGSITANELSSSSSSSNNPFEIQEEINRNAALNKAMSESIIQQQLNTSSSTSTSEIPANNNEMFTCLYCNHTFKSQYCYQKHARRHLNPVSLDGKNPSTSSASSTTTNGMVLVQQRRSTSPIRENKLQRSPIKLLDMNVQYYPCKTCGSKFPSYYFVHKHRKLCHADEMADNTNKNNEMLPENSNSKISTSNNNNNETSDSESSAQIDVEAVNNDA